MHEVNNYPPAGTWDVIDRHGEPRYVVEHDGKGGWFRPKVKGYGKDYVYVC